jgi:hypothetical protein
MDIFQAISDRRSTEALGIPAQIRVVALTPLGYPDQEPKPRPRKELSEIAFYENWGRTC